MFWAKKEQKQGITTEEFERIHRKLVEHATQIGELAAIVDSLNQKLQTLRGKMNRVLHEEEPEQKKLIEDNERNNKAQSLNVGEGSYL